MKKKLSYIDSVHRDGTIWNLGVMLLLMAFPVTLCFLFSTAPDWGALVVGLIATAPMYWAVGIIETITFVPMLGAGGSYLSFVTGNISNLKLPCALNALEQNEVSASSEEGEVISTIAIAVSSIVTTLIIILGVVLIIPLTPLLESPVLNPAFEQMLAALFGGLLTGAGCALTFLGGGSTGGVDIIAFIICKFIPRIKSSTMIFVLDAAIILMGMMVTKNIVITLLGILCAFTMALMIDKVFLGQSRALVAHIISTQHESIEREIIERLDRTTTVIPAHGGYTGQPYHMLMVTFTMNQYASLLDIIKRNDKRAFVTIQPVHEINGEGFTEQ